MSDMERIKGLKKFRRFYFHGLRNGFKPEDVVVLALQKTREEVLELLMLDPAYPTMKDKEKKWNEVASVLLKWKDLLKSIPLDVSRLPRTLSQDMTKAADPPKLDGVIDYPPCPLVDPLDIFKWYYEYGITNGLNSEQASDQAVERSRKDIWRFLENDPTYPTRLDKEERWGEILELFIEWHILLINVPLEQKPGGEG